MSPEEIKSTVNMFLKGICPLCMNMPGSEYCDGCFRRRDEQGQLIGKDEDLST